MRETIIEKINNKDLTFNEIEQKYISQDEEIFLKLVDVLKNDKNLLNDSILHLFEYNIDDNFFDYIIGTNLFFLLLEYMLVKNNELLYDQDLDLLSEEEKEIIFTEVRQKLINNDFDDVSFSSLPNYFLRMILEEKKYNIFENTHEIDNIPDDLTNLLLEYINSVDELPSSFRNYCESNEVPYEKWPLSLLLYKAPNTDDTDKLYTIIISKIINRQRISENDINYDFYTKQDINFQTFANAKYDINNPNERLKIINLLLDRHYISNYINDITEEEYKSLKAKIINVINDKSSIVDFYYDASSFLYSDFDLLYALIKSERIEIAQRYYNFITFVEANFDDCIDSIINYLTNKKTHYDTFLTNELLNSQKAINYLYDYLANHETNISLSHFFLRESGILYKAIQNNDIELFKRLINNTNNINFDEDIIDYIINNLTNDEEFTMNFLEKNRNSILDNKKLSEFFLSHNEQTARVIVDLYNHAEEDKVIYTKSMYDQVKGFLCKDNNITNINHLDYLADYFGYDIIRYLDNKTIQELVSLNDEEFSKIINLFLGEYTYTEAYSLYDSLKQKEFADRNLDIINIFANIKHSIEDKSIDYSTLLKIVNSIDDNFYVINPDKIEIKHNEFDYLTQIINKIIDGNLSEEEIEEYFEIIHKFTEYYIAKRREDYRKRYDFENECNISFSYDEKSLRNKFIKEELLFIDPYQKRISDKLCSNYNLSIDEVKNIMAYFLYKIIDYPNNLNQTEKTEYERKIKSNIKYLIKECNEFIDEEGIDFDPLFFEKDGVKKNYVYSTKKRVLSILSELNIDAIKKNLLDGTRQKDYKLLESLMKKYKFHLLPNYFEELLTKVDLTSNITDIAGFISYFYKIVDLERKRAIKNGLDPNNISFNAINILKNAEAFSSVSSVYNQILSPEDAKLVKLNPPNNAATGISSSERIEIATKQTISNFKREKVHIPCFNKIVSFKSGDTIKKLRVVVGNFTHPCNITHGERTGACMRIGGAGSTLFNFCLNNDFGFHIRFEDAETGEYISRVSGFRNGNTVFLNELRESCNIELFENEDIIEALKIASNILIEQSKESNAPIDNVFVHREYATKNDETMQSISFNGIDIKKGLPHFYSDISLYGLLVSSSQVPPKEIQLGTNLPDYKPAREVVYKGNDKVKLLEMINRVNIIKRVLNNEELSEIEPLISNKEEIKYGIASQDFYIYIDEDGKIHEDIINIDERALNELEEARLEIQEHLKHKKLPSLEGMSEEQKQVITEQINQEQIIIDNEILEETQIKKR